jgi:hypothetical protein
LPSFVREFGRGEEKKVERYLRGKRSLDVGKIRRSGQNKGSARRDQLLIDLISAARSGLIHLSSKDEWKLMRLGNVAVAQIFYFGALGTFAENQT